MKKNLIEDIDDYEEEIIEDASTDCEENIIEDADQDEEDIAQELDASDDNKKQYIGLPVATACGLQKYLATISKIPSLSKEEEFNLAVAYIEKKDLNAAHKLILSHLKLVAKIAFSYKNYNIPTIDMISEGNIGLLKAVDKYNPQLGYRLSTYSMWWIKAAIQDYILKTWSMVKTITTLPHKKVFLALRRLKKRIINVHINSHPEEYRKIAEDLNLSIKEVLDMEDRILKNTDVSIYEQIGYQNEDSEKQLIDTLPAPGPTQEVRLIEYQKNVEQKLMLKEALNILNPRELDIIKSRNLVETPSTLNDLSKRFNISQERVRQIEEHALKKIKKYISEKKPLQYKIRNY